MADRLLQMGRLGRPHGIRGEIGADWRGEWEPAKGDSLYLKTGAAPARKVAVAGSRRHNGRLLLRLVGVDDRAQAGQLTGSLILAEAGQAGEPGEDEVFAADLPGFRVFLADGSELGMLDHVEFPAGRMIWAIVDGNGREILFPADPSFIRSLDASGRKAVIEPPEGLLDIYRA